MVEAGDPEYEDFRSAADSMVADYRRGYCSCYDAPEECGYHRLGAVASSDDWDLCWAAGREWRLC